MVSSQIICTNKPLWLGWMVVIFQALVGCHDILILGKSPIKWRQRPDMTLAVDWDVKHQLKQTNHHQSKWTHFVNRMQFIRAVSPDFFFLSLKNDKNHDQSN